MYASIYSKVFNKLPSTPPSETASSSNFGETLSGSGNSLWECKSNVEGSIVSRWDKIPVSTPIAPTKIPQSSDVGAQETAADGSLWTAIQSGSSSVKKWTRTGNKTAFPYPECSSVGLGCSVINEETTSCVGSPNGGPTLYDVLKCSETITYTYTWQLVRPRKSCTSCPPSQSSINGEQCYCSNNDEVYQYFYENTQITTYYWQKVRDDTILGISISNIVKHISGEVTKKALDDDDASYKGYLEAEVENPFIYTLHDDAGKIIYSGFIKSWSYDEELKLVEFDSKDFKNIFDTEVIIDYSNGPFDSKLSSIFTKVSEAINEKSGNINYQFAIPLNEKITSDIANYSDQYVVVNAKNFLKVYLLFYGFYIKSSFEPDTLTINIEFCEASEELYEIKLEDFMFEKTKTNIQSNHTLATIKFQTLYEVDSEWTAATETDYNIAATEDKGTLLSNNLPPLDGFSKDYVLRLIKNAYFEEITETEYNNLNIKQEESIKLSSGNSTPGEIVSSIATSYDNKAKNIINHAPLIFIDDTPIGNVDLIYQSGITVNVEANIGDVIGVLDVYEEGSLCEFDGNINLYWNVTNMFGTFRIIVQACSGYVKYACPISSPSLSVIEVNFNPEDYIYEQGLKIHYINSNNEKCESYTYVKISSNSLEYWKKGGSLVIPRPKTLASKNYYLGVDNNIYSGDIPDELKLYPVKSKIFEYDSLAKSQIEAIYELLNTRWNENIKIDNTKKPIDLDYNFLQKIKIYDKNGNSKILPLSEKYYEINEVIENQKIKLGFKKEFFSEIYNGNESKGVVK